MRPSQTAPVPLMPSYAISKAAAFNMTRSLRALLAAKGVRVHAVCLGRRPERATPQSAWELLGRDVVGLRGVDSLTPARWIHEKRRI
jgi:NAD(P)-dependent dehydrogenase (short-subunit alcohol dehydrogenase family)